MDIGHQLDRMKESFLWAAAKGGREEEVESLLSIGADVNWRNGDEGETPLIAACRSGHRGVAALLLAHGGDARHQSAAEGGDADEQGVAEYALGVVVVAAVDGAARRARGASGGADEVLGAAGARGGGAGAHRV